MLAGGETLERYASSRARRELTALLARAPQVAHREHGGAVSDIEVEAVVPGDGLLVKTGEIVPVDGVMLAGLALLDESTLTGESRLVELGPGQLARSGAVNAGPAFRLRATATAADSTYGSLIRLVEEADASKAPTVRLADRYAGQFVLLTLGLAGGTWVVTGSAVRALAVLVAASPCPLLLAAPAAVVAGISRAARHGIIIKDGGALETLARARVALMDKTGTITMGRPRLSRIESFDGANPDELLRVAACLEQVSVHPFAPALLAAAAQRQLPLSLPADTQECLGAGIEGIVDGRRVRVGQLDWVADGAPLTADAHGVARRCRLEGSSAVFVAVDGHVAGALVLDDALRPEAPRAVRALRQAGVEQVLLVTGDHPDVAELVGDAAGVDRVLAEQSPQDKVAAVADARRRGVTVRDGGRRRQRRCRPGPG